MHYAIMLQMPSSASIVCPVSSRVHSWLRPTLCVVIAKYLANIWWAHALFTYVSKVQMVI